MQPVGEILDGEMSRTAQSEVQCKTQTHFIFKGSVGYNILADGCVSELLHYTLIIKMGKSGKTHEIPLGQNSPVHKLVHDH